MQAPSSSPQLETQLLTNRYIQQDILGKGGMGVVYLAKDRLTQEQVALKRVKLPDDPNQPHSTYASSIQEQLPVILAREFQFLAGLRHPNIIPVLDYGFDAEKQPFFTMPFLQEGQTILEAGAGLEFEGKIDLITQLLQGLAYLHRRGILHRDIKPENVLVTNGVVQLLDFGLSQNIGDESQTGGSPNYMAPELLDGDEATPNSDLFAVGILFYQLLTGHHPFGKFDVGYFQRLYTSEPDVSKIDDEWVRTLLTSLLSQNPRSRPQSAQYLLQQLYLGLSIEAPAESAAIRESYLQAATFVGRKRELAHLTTALRELDRKNAKGWLIGGESGVGKTRLLNEARIRALTKGYAVLRGQAVEGGGLPFQVWRNIVRRLLLMVEVDDFQAGVLKEIVPDVGLLLGRDIHTAPKLSGQGQQRRLILTIVSLLREVNQPILLLLEDLQWAVESIPLLQHIFLVAEQLPHLIIMANYRSDESPDLPKTLGEMTHIALNRLESNAIRSLSESILGQAGVSNELIQLLESESEGNSYFLIETVRALAEEIGHLSDISKSDLPARVLTGGMRSLMQRRLDSVSAQFQSLQAFAAIAGRQIDVQLLEHQFDKKQVAAWLNQAGAHGVLAVQDNQWQFSHDKLRETLASQLPSEQKKKQHRHVARAIETIYAEDAQFNAILLAHWQAAEDTKKEEEYLLPVAEKFIRLTADYDQARILLKRALELTPQKGAHRAKLLIRHAESYFRQGRFSEGEKYAQESLTVAQDVGYQQGIADGYNHLGIAAESRRDLEISQDYFERSLAIFQKDGDKSGIASILNHLGIVAWNERNFETASSYYEKSLAAFKEVDDQQGVGSILLNLGIVALSQNDYRSAQGYYQESLEIAQSMGDRHSIASCFNQLGAVTINLGQLTVAQSYLENSLAICTEIKNWRVMGYCLYNLGEIAWLRGQYDIARSHYKQQLAHSQSGGAKRSIASSLRLLGLVDHLEGNYTSAQSFYTQAMEIYQELEDKNYTARCLCYFGDLARNRGDFSEAYENYTQCRSIWKEIDHKQNLLDAHKGFGALYLKQDEPTAGLAHLKQALQLAIDENMTIELGSIYGYLAQCQSALRDHKAALSTALEHFERFKDCEADRSEGMVHLAVAQTLTTSNNGKEPSAILQKLAGLTGLEVTPEAYFEAALESAYSYDSRLTILMSYGRYLLQNGAKETAYIHLNEAKKMAEANNLTVKTSQIEALIAGKPERAPSPKSSA